MAPEATVQGNQNDDVPRLENLTLSQRAHTFLRDEILSNRLPPGTELQEVALLGDFSFGRPVRITAETFMAAVAALHNNNAGAGGNRLDLNIAWLIGTARHKLIDHWRRTERRKEELAELWDDMATIPPTRQSRSPLPKPC